MNKSSFKTFCSRIAFNQHTDIDTDDDNIEEKYVKPSQVIVSIIKPKLEILDKVSISFIENAFIDSAEVESLLESKVNSIIPDTLLNHLSKKIYEKTFNEITDEEQVIIKTLSVYICIQI